MSEWIDATVADVTKYQKAGGTPVATNPDYYAGDIPFVVIEDITKSSRFLEKTENTLSGKGLLNSAAWLIQEPHILYSMYATVGKPIINKISCATNQAIIALKENELIEQEFLYYQLLFIRPSVHKFTAQTTQSNLNAGVVKRLPIAYPQNKVVQRKIVKILGTIDETIAHTEALIQKYQQIKAGLMHDLFTRGITSDGQLRLPREQAPELYKESAIGWIPREWETLNASSFISSLDAGKSPECPDKPAGADQWGVLKVSAISPDGLKSFENKVLEKNEFHNPAFMIKNGDLLISHANTPELVGMICYVEEVRSNLLLSDKTLRIHTNSNQIDKRFLYWSFQYNRTRKQVEVRATGSSGSMKNISQQDIKSLLISMPKNIEEQHQIKRRLDTVLSRLKKEKTVCSKFKSMKTGLMQDLLTGKVPVTLSES